MKFNDFSRNFVKLFIVAKNLVMARSQNEVSGNSLLIIVWYVLVVGIGDFYEWIIHESLPIFCSFIFD